MLPNANSTESIASWRELQQLNIPPTQQLNNIKTHLDLIFLALEAIANIGSEAILAAAQKLNLESTIGDRVELWRLRQSNPLRQSSGGRKKLDVEEARSFVLIICYLAQQNYELLRRAVTLLEEVNKQKEPPHKTALLGEYLDKFINLYQERMQAAPHITTHNLSQLALKLMVDLLFYSSRNGHRLLWLALIDRPRKGEM